MNTCAECRFWKDDDLVKRFGAMPTNNTLGVFKECTVTYENAPAVFVAAIYAQDYALITRSDFGCVQFEPMAQPTGVRAGTYTATPEGWKHESEP